MFVRKMTFDVGGETEIVSFCGRRLADNIRTSLQGPSDEETVY